ncbi:MAG: 23S rRNA (guanosine(2251)-2'-O)-methyltransferase RlmB [Candidatus Omnitrophota bacterium]
MKDSMYLYGKNSVFERLKANPKSIKKAYLQENFNNQDIIRVIYKRKVPVERLNERGLLKIKNVDRLQGIVAEVDRFEYADFDSVLDNALDKRSSLIFLDNINDPHNLGSIIRIAACFGNFAIIIPTHRSCEVTDAVMHVASGGENFLPIAMVTNISSSLIKAKKKGFWIAGAMAEGGRDITDIELPLPVCLVLGSEGKGIRHGIDKQLDIKLTIPMRGEKLSFNVSMACAILCHEISNRTLKNR